MKTKFIAAIMALVLSACGPGLSGRWFRVACYQYGVLIYQGEVDTTGSTTHDRTGNIVVLPKDGCIYVEIGR